MCIYKISDKLYPSNVFGNIADNSRSNGTIARRTVTCFKKSYTKFINTANCIVHVLAHVLVHEPEI
jgi:hypothetical protein